MYALLSVLGKKSCEIRGVGNREMKYLYICGVECELGFVIPKLLGGEFRELKKHELLNFVECNCWCDPLDDTDEKEVVWVFA